MDQRPGTALTDSALDREVESLFSVDPSPEFLARVRTRVAAEPASSHWGWNVRFVMGATAAVVVIAIMGATWMAMSTPMEAPQQVALPTDVTLEPALRGDPVQPAPAKAVPAEPRRVQTGRRAAPDAAPFAEVLISENEQRAFAMLLARIEQGRLPPLPAAMDIEQSLEPPAINIPELVVEPLPEIAALE